MLGQAAPGQVPAEQDRMAAVAEYPHGWRPHQGRVPDACVGTAG